MTADTIAANLSEMEQLLLDPRTRADRERVEDLLAEGFVEFGSSGRIWNRTATLAALAAEKPVSATTRTVSDLTVRLLAETVALVTYVVSRGATGVGSVQSLRSSIWTREGGKWRMVFHQGTVAL